MQKRDFSELIENLTNIARAWILACRRHVCKTQFQWAGVYFCLLSRQHTDFHAWHAPAAAAARTHEALPWLRVGPDSCNDSMCIFLLFVRRAGEWKGEGGKGEGLISSLIKLINRHGMALSEWAVQCGGSVCMLPGRAVQDPLRAEIMTAYSFRNSQFSISAELVNPSRTGTAGEILVRRENCTQLLQNCLMLSKITGVQLTDTFSCFGGVQKDGDKLKADWKACL